MKQLQNYVTPIFVTFAIAFCLVGVLDAIKQGPRSLKSSETVETTASPVTTPVSLPTTEVSRNEALATSNFIAGPLASNIGELCVFNLNDPKLRADWAVIRQKSDDAAINAYVDSSGSSVVFTSKDASRYTVVAAVVDEGAPRILQHICDYGTSPNPQPEPDPEPKPEPVSLAEWVAQNVPEPCKTEAGMLASIYESAAQGIERGTIKTRDAAFAVIRTNTQTKIRNMAWNEFLEQLSGKVIERIGENREISELATVFSEIATGLKKVSVTNSVVIPRRVSQAPAATSSYIVPQSTVRYNNVMTPFTHNSALSHQRPTGAGSTVPSGSSNCGEAAYFPQIYYGGRR